jgi:vacuolar iron transporter family protein
MSWCLIETRHLAFWQKFFDLRLDRLNLGRQLKLWCFTWLCRLFASTAVHLVLEAIEVYGVRKYLTLWNAYQDQQLGE